MQGFFFYQAAGQRMLKGSPQALLRGHKVGQVCTGLVSLTSVARLFCSFQKASNCNARLVVETEFVQGFVEPAPL